MPSAFTAPTFLPMLLGIALFGGLGAAVRLVVSGWHGKLPWGILSANIVASLMVGFAFTGQGFWTGLLATGFAGGLSTFSSWAAQTSHYLGQNQRVQGYLNFVLNLVLPACAVVAGMYLGSTLLK
jgi:CrcB protein